MVKLGFIGEGAVEKRILESPPFRDYLRSVNIDFVADVIDAEGKDNLPPVKIDKYSRILEDKGATKIIILTDLDDHACITSKKEDIRPTGNHIVIVSVKEIEAWFLADEIAVKLFLKDNHYSIENPEQIANPFEKIRQLRIEKIGRGIGSKVLLAKQMIGNHNFSILRAAQHPNCASAKYFIEKINGFSVKPPST